MHNSNLKILGGIVALLILGLMQWIPSTALGAPPTQAAPCAENYTVQADDWLSKIADKFLGDAQAYPVIFEATNQQHTADNAFALIENANLIEVGWQLCIPSSEQAELLLTQTSTASAALEPADLTLFAAASLTEAFTEIGQNFEVAYPGVTVTFNFAGSQQLAQQLGQGAPADVFASANNTQMDVAIEAGRVISGTQQTFVYNRLTVIYPIDNPMRLNQLEDLANPDLHLILAATEVPVGRYSLEFLDKAADDVAFGTPFKDQVLNNIVSYEPNVKVVLTKIALGEGDAGIVYSSDVTPDVADQVGHIEIPDALNTIAAYPIAAISDSRYPTQAAAFTAYILSPEAQAVLARYGFIARMESKASTP
ncbi:MAG: molybdate ABC transporter substrate-binding protein [Anaerolineae bacterium]|nr:molybdate ABC transporter substrate-binding protein [Anaerolineae bacterium]